VKRLLLAFLGGEIERRVAVPGRDRQQVGQKRDGLAEVIGSLSQHLLQLGQPLISGVLAPETGRPLKLGDARIERTVLVMGRAEIAQARMRLAAQPLHDSLSDARLADPRLAANQDHLPLAPLRLRPSAQ